MRYENSFPPFHFPSRFSSLPFPFFFSASKLLCPKIHYPAHWSWGGDLCFNTEGSEVQIWETITPGVFCKFCGYIWWCGCVWLPRKCGKVVKKINFLFFFTMKLSRLKIMEKVLIFFCGLACCDSVWLPRKCGKVEKKKKFPNISYQSSPRTGYLSNFFLIKKHKLFGNLIKIGRASCRERV